MNVSHDDSCAPLQTTTSFVRWHDVVSLLWLICFQSTWEHLAHSLIIVMLYLLLLRSSSPWCGFRERASSFCFPHCVTLSIHLWNLCSPLFTSHHLLPFHSSLISQTEGKVAAADVSDYHICSFFRSSQRGSSCMEHFCGWSLMEDLKDYHIPSPLLLLMRFYVNNMKKRRSVIIFYEGVDNHQHQMISDELKSKHQNNWTEGHKKDPHHPLIRKSTASAAAIFPLLSFWCSVRKSILLLLFSH